MSPESKDDLEDNNLEEVLPPSTNTSALLTKARRRMGINLEDASILTGISRERLKSFEDGNAYGMSLVDLFVVTTTYGISADGVVVSIWEDHVADLAEQLTQINRDLVANNTVVRFSPTFEQPFTRGDYKAQITILGGMLRRTEE
jgi:hypothetical protein